MPSLPLAVFRADADPRIGGGHIMRCLTLAHAFTRAGWRCAFASLAESVATVPRLAHSGYPIVDIVGDPPEDVRQLLQEFGAKADLLVFDHPSWSAAEESPYRAAAAETMAIDGLRRRHATDLWLDPNPDHRVEDLRPLAPPSCRILHGLDFMPIAPATVSARQASLTGRRDRAFRLNQVLVNFGAGDQLAALELALRGVAMNTRELQVTVVAGSQSGKCRELADRLDLKCEILDWSDDLAGLMRQADLMIGAAGISAWERCCLGLPSLLLTVAENQLGTAGFLGIQGAAINLGPIGSTSPTKIADSLTELGSNPRTLERMSGIAAGLVDGGGADRVVAAISPHRPV